MAMKGFTQIQQPLLGYDAKAIYNTTPKVSKLTITHFVVRSTTTILYIYIYILNDFPYSLRIILN